MAGIVKALRLQQSRRGRMAVVQLDDGTARMEVTVYNELFEASRNLVKEDQLLVVEGRSAERRVHRRHSARRPRKIYDLLSARAKFARSMRLVCNGQSSGAKLRELPQPYRPGSCPVSIVYSNHDAAVPHRSGRGVARQAGRRLDPVAVGLAAAGERADRILGTWVARRAKGIASLISRAALDALSTRERREDARGRR